MSYVHSVDWGQLRCVPLLTSDDAYTDLNAQAAGWTTSGEATSRDRIAILTRAKQLRVPLAELSHKLNIKWSHFEEWGEQLNLTPFEIVLNHLPWKDELLLDDNNNLTKSLEIKFPANSV